VLKHIDAPRFSIYLFGFSAHYFENGQTYPIVNTAFALPMHTLTGLRSQTAYKTD
jgi:hypothetical protein